MAGLVVKNIGIGIDSPIMVACKFEVNALLLYRKCPSHYRPLCFTVVAGLQSTISSRSTYPQFLKFPRLRCRYFQKHLLFDNKFQTCALSSFFY